jgi:hypothetical protein
MTGTFDEISAALEDADEGHALLRGLRNGTWLDAQEFPPLSWVVPSLVPEGMSMLIGGPKIGKSWLSLDIALAVASGGRALGTVETGLPRPVLHLALEDGDRRLKARTRELRGELPNPRLWDYMTRIEPNMVVPTIEAWLETIEPDDVPLVILDTLGKVMPQAMPGESPYQRDYRIAGRLKRICDDRPGMALLVLHHDRKATSEDFVDGVSGTNGIAGAADTIIVISRTRTETTGLFKVTGRDVVEREYAVTVEGGAWRLIGEDLSSSASEAQTMKLTANLGDRSADILRLVSERPQGVRAAEVCTAMDISADDARRYLHRLHEAGKLGKPERGLYAPRGLSVPSVLFGGSANSEQDTQDRQDTYSGGVPGRDFTCGHDPGVAGLNSAGLCWDCERKARSAS